MKFELFKDVILKVDVPRYKLKKGDIVTVVEVYPKTIKHNEHYACEIFSILGKSLGVCTLGVDQIESIKEDFVYIASARKLKKAS
ncbi:MAG: DUF4926 domain-containing protein [Leptospiraceae bacterium]|nr:DUF4926 domain-containing protein [Leptospiraceae bacterium]